MSNASSGERQDLLQHGALLDNRYEIHDLLGEGGFSDVYRAMRVDTQQPVAIKLLHLPSSRRAKRSFRERFLREAKAASRVSHVKIVDIYGYGVHEDGRPYMALELLDGHTLDEELRERGPLDKARAIPLFIDALEALQAAHSLGIVHRDLKPSNLYINYPDTPEEALHILDFGIAFMSEDNQSRLTQTGQINGTPQYLAPEYIMRQIVSPALDVYQMGLIFVEMFSGVPVVNQDNTYQCFMQHCSGKLDIPTEALGDALTEVAMSALKLDPQQRFANAGFFRDALVTLSAGRGRDDGPEPTLNDPPPAELIHAFNKEETDPSMPLGPPGPYEDSGPTKVQPASPFLNLTPAAPATQMGMPAPDGESPASGLEPAAGAAQPQERPAPAHTVQGMAPTLEEMMEAAAAQPGRASKPTPPPVAERPAASHTVQGMAPSLDEMRAAAAAQREPGRHEAPSAKTRRTVGARKAGSGKGAIANLRKKLAARKAATEEDQPPPSSLIDAAESQSLDDQLEQLGEAQPFGPALEDVAVDLFDAGSATSPEIAPRLPDSVSEDAVEQRAIEPEVPRRSLPVETVPDEEPYEEVEPIADSELVELEQMRVEPPSLPVAAARAAPVASGPLDLFGGFEPASSPQPSARHLDPPQDDEDDDPPDLFDLAIDDGPDKIGRPIDVGRIVAASHDGEALSRPANLASDQAVATAGAGLGIGTGHVVNEPSSPRLSEPLEGQGPLVQTPHFAPEVEPEAPSPTQAGNETSLAKTVIIAVILAVIVGAAAGLFVTFYPELIFGSSETAPVAPQPAPEKVAPVLPAAPAP